MIVDAEADGLAREGVSRPAKVVAARSRQVMRAARVVLGLVMIVVPFAAMSHVGVVPGAPPDATDASGANGTVVALLAAFVCLAASRLTVLDPKMAYRRASCPT